MISLGPLGLMGWQGAVYFIFLLPALAICFHRREPGYDALALIMLVNWLGTRLIDVAEPGSGGMIGEWLISDAGSVQEAVTKIAIGLIILDFAVAACLLQFSRILTLSRVTALLFAAMLPFYLFAAIGWMSGGEALDYVFGLGLLQLAIISLTASGGSRLVANWSRHTVVGRRTVSYLEILSAWLGPRTNLDGSQADLDGTSKAARHQR